jgi:peptide/nickel transport system substrate-binding protein
VGSRRRLSRRGVVRGGLALAGLGLAGCASPNVAVPAPAATSAPAAGAPATSVPAAAPTATAPAAKFGGVFRQSISTASNTLDVHLGVSQVVTDTGPGAAYSRLMRQRLAPGMPEGSSIPEGDLAESWQQVDETTYIFKMRPGVKFHNIAPVNGRVVNADDIVYSQRRQIDLRVNAFLFAGVAKMEAPDPSTVKITLEQPDADFLVSLTDQRNKIVAREAVELKGDLREGPTVGTGPFLLDRYDPDNIVTFVRNPDYFIKGLPRIERLEFPRIPAANEAGRISAFRANQLEVIQGNIITVIDPEQFKAAIPNLGIQRQRSTGSGIELVLKADEPPYSDKRVRQAFSKAIDRQTIIDTVMPGQGWLSVGIKLPDVNWAIPPDEIKQLWRRDLAAARRLLTEAGFANGLDTELTLTNYGPSFISVGELMAAQLAEAGIRAKIKVIDAAAYTTQILTGGGKFEALVVAGSPNPTTNADIYARWHSKGARNPIFGFRDPRLDQMITRQYGLRNEAERKTALLEIQRFIVEEAFYSHILSSISLQLEWPYVKDYFIAGSVDPMRFAYLWLDK